MSGKSSPPIEIDSLESSSRSMSAISSRLPIVSGSSVSRTGKLSKESSSPEAVSSSINDRSVSERGSISSSSVISVSSISGISSAPESNKSVS